MYFDSLAEYQAIHWTHCSKTLRYTHRLTRSSGGILVFPHPNKIDLISSEQHSSEVFKSVFLSYSRNWDHFGGYMTVKLFCVLLGVHYIAFFFLIQRFLIDSWVDSLKPKMSKDSNMPRKALKYPQEFRESIGLSKNVSSRTLQLEKCVLELCLDISQ
jgi:hypothetical protein